MEQIYLTIALAPLVGAIFAGFFGSLLGRMATNVVTILGVLISTILSLYVFNHHVLDGGEIFNQNLYTWMQIGELNVSVGFLIDNLTAIMLVIVSFVSLMVHIYTIGYMHDDAGYTKFFSYISLFTFSMFMLVMSNNFMQLFFGWEAVGLVSYLLIGFWHHKESAVEANLKAFLVNRVGDFGFLLGIALVLMYFGSLDYVEVFASLGNVTGVTMLDGTSVITVICILLFIGAMGKSAQVPLHVWLPGSMEGPTPISALIHAATMVTAGIFMVSRMSPMFELSETALMVVMIVGAITALFMGLLGIVQNDIKKVVAYSTLSQLGYMTVALGVSAYSVAIFHLMTHAFFKALLFLGAGSVIVALHHKQDIREMGGLRKKMPITYWTALIGTLALIGFPGFAGFYSKDMIIEAVHFSQLPFSDWVYVAVILGVFITAFYSLRMFFLVFHGESRMDEHTTSHVKESPFSITLPLVALAIPSAVIGYLTIDPMLFNGWLDNAITVGANHSSMVSLKESFHGASGMIPHALQTWPFWMMVGGIASAWVLTLHRAEWATWIQKKFHRSNYVLESLYGFDRFNDIVFVQGVKKLGNFLWKVSDSGLIDKILVNGSARLVGFIGSIVRPIQTGYVYHYAFFMIFSLLIILTWVLFAGDNPLLKIEF
ncbi:NADH:ubiquinone oxidoreductase subunit L [Candidatus Thioglobus autotrophicus]|uniref:NADH:ubiquinone oxidoreductase subunit L n=1 Tax=Candidatus Thioglobus autotrophicus TaxID=1705394 RepID=A0A0M4PL07_9GAMM|nr:NADH-quinone oxidoreductase subunit L [Candidatus Thioglobus autotrophicus]ALE52737.1 NADH:ubiquinone oxidoreductase subunit L [Candidatus Thioglobus autotrophicus]